MSREIRRRAVIKDGSRTSHYDFDLPAGRIAQHPTDRRGDSRIMVVNRSTGEITHRQFSDLDQLIPAGDAIVLNTTRVFRARLLGLRDNGAPAEILLLRSLGDSLWEAMVHPGGKLKPGRVVRFAEDFEAEIVSTTERRTRVVRLNSSLPLDQAIEKYGHVPLPPYITRADQASDDRARTELIERQAALGRERRAGEEPGEHHDRQRPDADGVELLDDVVPVQRRRHDGVERREHQPHVLLHLERGPLQLLFDKGEQHAAVRPSGPAQAAPARGCAGV